MSSDKPPSSPFRAFRYLIDYFRYRKTVAPDALAPEERRASMNKVIVAWVFGMIYAYGITGAPLVGMLTELGATPFWIGLLAAIPSVGMVLQLVGSYIVRRTGSRKRVFLRFAYPGRILWGVMILLAAVLPPGLGTVAVVLGVIFVARLSDMMAGPAWIAWISDLVPEKERGNFWGTRQMWGGISGTIGMLVLNYYMGDGPPFHKYVVFFSVVVFMGWLDVFTHRGVSSVTVELDREPPRFARMFWDPIRNKQFSPLLLFGLSFSFTSAMGGSMFYLMMLKEIHLSYFEISLYMAGLLGGISAASSKPWGRVVDNIRGGARLTFVVTVLIVTMTMLAWPLVGVRQHLLIAPIVGVSGVAWSGLGIAVNTLLFGLSPQKERANYIAMYTLVAGAGSMLGGLVSGSLAEWLTNVQTAVDPLAPDGLLSPLHAVALLSPGISYTFGPLILTPLRTVYLIAGSSQVLTLMVLRLVREPDTKPVADYVRRLFGMNPFARRTYVYLRLKLSAQKPGEESSAESGGDGGG